ncbi:hypothetical protein BD413DRAFT_645602 [Trametes elegans]|nr:hypothetical protein BD413DRAFT_645602 [Trametes elegans]
MCGRFSLGVPHEEIEALEGYDVRVGEWVGREEFVPRHNIAPRSQAPVLRRREGDGAGSERGSGPSSSAGADGARAGEVVLQTMRWGLVPHWAKHEDGTLKTINARAEALCEGEGGGGTWGRIKGRRRCGVVCEGYYEWLKKGKERLPHFTKRKDGRLMVLAGLWDSVLLEGSTSRLWTFTIVTTEACEELRWLHDRQPVILPDKAALDAWLDTSSRTWTAELGRLCASYTAHDAHPLLCYQVPKEVGKIGNESPAFVQPVQHRILALFASQAAARKRSPSPATRAAGGERAKKRAKAEDAHEEQPIDVDAQDDPRDAPSTPKAPPVLTLDRQPSPRKRKNTQRSDSSPKITAFFPKK